MPLTLDDLKNWWLGVTNPDKWQRAADELHLAHNTWKGYQNIITPSGSSPIPGPPASLADVWHQLSASLDQGKKGYTQPTNQSGNMR